MKRKWKVAIGGVCAAVLLTVVYAAAAAAAGSQGDPLVTLSYLKNVFTGEVEAMVDQAVSDAQAQNKSEFDAALGDWNAQVSQAVENAVGGEGAGASFIAAAMADGQTMKLSAGGEIIVRFGSFVSSVDLIDATDGSVLTAGNVLKASHLYFSAKECTLTVSGTVMTGTVNAGPLNVREGAGSSYDILGTLPTGTAVTILDTSNSGWYKITSASLSGYVSASYITINSSGSSTTAELLVRGTYTLS